MSVIIHVPASRAGQFYSPQSTPSTSEATTPQSTPSTSEATTPRSTSSESITATALQAVEPKTLVEEGPKASQQSKSANGRKFGLPASARNVLGNFGNWVKGGKSDSDSDSDDDCIDILGPPPRQSQYKGGCGLIHNRHAKERYRKEVAAYSKAEALNNAIKDRLES